MKTLIRYSTLFVCTIIAAASLAAQRLAEPNTREMLLENYVEFVFKELKLTTEQQQAIKPMLIEHDNQRFETWQDVRTSLQAIKKKNAVSESAHLEFLEKLLDAKLQNAKLEKEHFLRLAKIIPPSKVVEMQRLNREYSQKVMKKHGGKPKNVPSARVRAYSHLPSADRDIE